MSKRYIYRILGILSLSVAILASAGDAAAAYSINKKLITSVGQLSSNATADYDGGGLDALIDENAGTYWHSVYKDENLDEEPYLQVHLNETLCREYVYLRVQRRDFWEGHPVQFRIYARKNGDSGWRSLAQWDIPYRGEGSTEQSGALYIPFKCDDLRFVLKATSHDSRAGKGQLYMHMAEFQIYQSDVDPRSDDFCYNMALRDYGIRNTMGVLDETNRKGDEALQNWCDWGGCWSTDGVWKKDVDKLKQYNITIPTFSFITRDEDPRLDAGVRMQRAHTEEHVVYALPGDVVRLLPYSDFYNSGSYMQQYVRWYDYKSGGTPSNVDMHLNPVGVLKTDNIGYLAGNGVSHSVSGIRVDIYDYQISSADDYIEYVKLINSGGQRNAIMVCDIDLAGFTVEPIENFVGYFNGNGFAIYNMKINKSGKNAVGMFGSTAKGYSKIYNLRLVNADITGENFVGGFVGVNEGQLDLISLSFEGTVTGNVNTAGILGLSNGNAWIWHSCVAGKVNGEKESAAIAGWLRSDYNDACIRNSYNIAEVSGVEGSRYFYRAANDDQSFLSNCFDRYEVSGSDKIGKLKEENGTFKDSDGNSIGSEEFCKKLNTNASDKGDWRVCYDDPLHPRAMSLTTWTRSGIAFGSYATYCCPDDESFDEEYVVADISQSYDAVNNIDKDGRQIIEPAVELRHLFIIRNGQTFADEMSGSVEKNKSYISSNRRTVSARAGHDFNVRLDIQFPVEKDAPSPIYYKASDDSYKHVYGCDVCTFDASTGQPVSNEKMFYLSDEKLSVGGARYNGITQLDCMGAVGTSYYRTIRCDASNALQGTFVVKLFAKDENGGPVKIAGTDTPLQVAEYVVSFMPESAASLVAEDELLSNDKYAGIRELSLKEKYGEPRAVLDFDEFNNLEDGDSSNDFIFKGYCGEGNRMIKDDDNEWDAKMFKWNVPWQNSSYGFGYDFRRDYSMYLIANHSRVVPYSLTAEWWHNKENNFNKAAGLYDRLFYNTEGQKSGYFYYVNAASDPGIMANIPMGELCNGSTLCVSAWVAEFSDAHEIANLILNFKARLKSGREVILHSFVTGYVDDNYAAGNGGGPGVRPNLGKWIHIYYSFIPNLSEYGITTSEIDSYYLTLENNCISSSGADYAVDDIRVYVMKPRVYATQIKPVCAGEKNTDVKIEMPIEVLLSTIGMTEADTQDEAKTVNLFYTFLDKETYDDVYETVNKNGGESPGIAAFNASQIRYEYMPATDPGNKEQTFGKLTFSTYYNGLPEYEKNEDYNRACRLLSSDNERMLAFDTHPTDSQLWPGKEYILALFCQENDGVDIVESPGASDFNPDDQCSKICEFRVHASGVVKINGVAVQDLDKIICCANQQPVVQIDLWGQKTDEDGGLVEIQKDAYFDWYEGSMDDYMSECTGEGGNMMMLHDVMSKFRAAYPNAHTWDLEAKDEYTEEMRDYIASLAAADTETGRGKLHIYQSSYVFPPVNVPDKAHSMTVYVVAIPIDPSLDKDDYVICTTPAEVYVTVSNDSPSMLHGLPIDYPGYMIDVPLRIGLRQLESVSCESKDKESFGSLLSIPVRKVSPVTANVTSMKTTSDNLIYLVETNDPAY